MIPKVKRWIIRLDDGTTYKVDAPNKVLARLNFIHGDQTVVSGYRLVADHGFITGIWLESLWKVRRGGS